jgi:two-component system cell cycle sensor histidine kinase/response regulator CckA
MGIIGAAVALFSKRELQGTEQPPDSGRSAAAPKPTVLIIDDDASFLETMRILLRGAGYDVLTSSTGPKGLDMLRYGPRDVAAVLLDFNMPRFNGAETLQFLRKLTPNVKVLAVSGVNLQELPPEFRLGVERFVAKPFRNADLLKTIEEVLQDKPVVEEADSIPA